MESIRRVLLWEVIRNEPRIIFTLYCLSKSMQTHLSSDLSFIHYFLEEVFGKDSIRDLNWNEAQRLVRICLHHGSENYLACFMPNSKTLLRYHVRNEEKSEFIQDLPFSTPGYPEGNMIFLSDRLILYCGEWIASGDGTELVHTYDFENELQERKADMITRRNQHAMAMAEGNVYVFGGYDVGNSLRQSEMYSIRSNTWNALPDLPCNQKYSFATVHGDEILIASNGTNEFSAFNYKTKIHRLVNIGIPSGHTILISHESILYIICCNQTIRKITNLSDEESQDVKYLENSNACTFNYVYSPSVYHGNKYHLVDCERILLVFDVVNEQLTSQSNKFAN